MPCLGLRLPAAVPPRLDERGEAGKDEKPASGTAALAKPAGRSQSDNRAAVRPPPPADPAPLSPVPLEITRKSQSTRLLLTNLTIIHRLRHQAIILIDAPLLSRSVRTDLNWELRNYRRRRLMTGGQASTLRSMVMEWFASMTR